MLDFSILFVILAIAVMFGWLANNSRDSKHLRFLFFGLMFIMVIFAAYNLAGLVVTPVSMLNYTTEDSFYWNCTRNVTDADAFCDGAPEQLACAPYTEEQCLDIAGCTWSEIANCTGTPEVTCDWLGAYDLTGYKCEETAGCVWHETTWITAFNATCDSVNVTYVYGNYTQPTAFFGDSYYMLAWLLTIVFLIVLFLLFMDMLTESMHLFGRGAR